MITKYSDSSLNRMSDNSDENKMHTKKAQNFWKTLSRNILRSDIDDFKKHLKVDSNPLFSNVLVGANEKVLTRRSKSKSAMRKIKTHYSSNQHQYNRSPEKHNFLNTKFSNSELKLSNIKSSESKISNTEFKCSGYTQQNWLSSKTFKASESIDLLKLPSPLFSKDSCCGNNESNLAGNQSHRYLGLKHSTRSNSKEAKIKFCYENSQKVTQDPSKTVKKLSQKLVELRQENALKLEAYKKKLEDDLLRQSSGSKMDRHIRVALKSDHSSMALRHSMSHSILSKQVKE